MIARIKAILKQLIIMMSDPDLDMKVFRNMMAIYVMWQADL